MKKKLLYGLFIFVLVLGLAGCGNKEKDEEEKEEINTEVEEGYRYGYTLGTLTRILDTKGNPKQTDFIINGILLFGNRHEYSKDISEAAKEGYLKTKVNSSFYLNEYISIYMDADYKGSASNIKILAVPHASMEAYEALEYSQLEEVATKSGGFIIDCQDPDEDNYKYVGEGYISIDSKPGNYDILFTYKGKIAYFIEVALTKEV